MSNPTRPLVTEVDEPRWAEPGLLFVVMGNLVPLIGLLFFGWETFPLMLLFWCENVLIGLFNVLRMLTARPRDKLAWAAKAFLVPFFCIHYGMFTLVHGVFVMGFFGGAFRKGASFPGLEGFVQAILEHQLGWAVLFIAGGYAASFFWDYLRSGEYEQAKLRDLMQEPYGRVVVLHLTILGGAFLLAMLRTPSVVLILLVGLKMALDIRRYRKRQRKAVDKGA